MGWRWVNQAQRPRQVTSGSRNLRVVSGCSTQERGWHNWHNWRNANPPGQEGPTGGGVGAAETAHYTASLSGQGNPCVGKTPGDVAWRSPSGDNHRWTGSTLVAHRRHEANQVGKSF